MTNELTCMPSKYEFVTRFDYIPGNEELQSKRCKLFIAQDRTTKKLYIIKRMTNSQYNENEWKMPSKINSENIIRFVEVVHQKVDNQMYHYLISEYTNSKDLFDYYENTIKKCLKRRLYNLPN